MPLVTPEELARFTDKASKNAEELALYEATDDYIAAYSRHTDLRVRRDGPALAIGGQWEEHGPLQLRFLRDRGLEPASRLLDLGCGTGRLARHAVPYLDPGHYSGLDISPAALDHARNLAVAERWAARAPELLLGDGTLGAVRGRSFDLIWAHSVFNHLPPQAIESVVAGLRDLSFGAFYFTWKRRERPYRSGLKQWQVPFAFFVDVAARHGLRAAEFPVDWPQGQKTGMIFPRLER